MNLDYLKVGIVVLVNLFCAWILFGGGANRLEGTSLSWGMGGARPHGENSGWSASGLKIVAGIFVAFEIGIALIAGFATGWK